VYQVFRCFILESALVNFCTLCQCLALCGVFVFCDETFSCNVCVSYFLWTACDFFMLFFLVCFGLLAFLCSVSARCFVCLLPLLFVWLQLCYWLNTPDLLVHIHFLKLLRVDIPTFLFVGKHKVCAFLCSWFWVTNLSHFGAQANCLSTGADPGFFWRGRGD